MKFTSVEAIPVRVPRDIAAATGMAGSPTRLRGTQGDYRWSEVFPCLYSVNIETALLKLTTDSGLVGWGEAQAPLAPEVACTIINLLLKPVLLEEEFSGDAGDIPALWNKLYSTMRVRGQTGGFMIDAISAVDIALWDLAGKHAGKPVSALLDETPKLHVPAYLSGLPDRGRAEAACRAAAQSFHQVKLFRSGPAAAMLAAIDEIQQATNGQLRIAFDGLWQFTPGEAIDFGYELDKRGAVWFEAPLPPEDAVAHGEVARAIRTPVAIGESYRTTAEMAPFYREGAVGLLQPDLGRCGITEGMRLAAQALRHNVAVVPHISVAFGPQIAAALHFAAAVDSCTLAEYNPKVLEVANRFLRQPIRLEGPCYEVPRTPGLGADIDEDALRQVTG